MLQHTATHQITQLPLSTCSEKGNSILESLQHNTAAHCNKLQYTATHCYTLQHTFVFIRLKRKGQPHFRTVGHIQTAPIKSKLIVPDFDGLWRNSQKSALQSLYVVYFVAR